LYFSGNKNLITKSTFLGARYEANLSIGAGISGGMNLNNLLGYFNGQSVYPTTGNSESKVYSDLEMFITYLHNEKYTQIFNLGCALDVSKYYAVNKNGEPVLLDENAFREGKDPASHIDQLD